MQTRAGHCNNRFVACTRWGATGFRDRSDAAGALLLRDDFFASIMETQKIGVRALARRLAGRTGINPLTLAAIIRGERKAPRGTGMRIFCAALNIPPEPEFLKALRPKN